MSEFDFVGAHLKWISQNKDFKPSDYHTGGHAYLENMSEVYKNPFKDVQRVARIMFEHDLKVFKKQQATLKYMLKLTESVKSDEWFVTIGFNHQTFEVSRAVAFIKAISALEWVQDFKAVLETHRENGIHPHCHMYIKTELPKSKIVDKVNRSKGANKLILARNFIDVKPWCDYHADYIVGNKKDDKIKYVELDKQWRIQNNVPHLFGKSL